MWNAIKSNKTILLILLVSIFNPDPKRYPQNNDFFLWIKRIYLVGIGKPPEYIKSSMQIITTEWLNHSVIPVLIYFWVNFFIILRLPDL